MKNLKFSNIQGSKATMLIYKHIGNDKDLGMGIDGNSFANEVLCLNEYYADSIKAIDVRINSTGGDVQHGYSIISAMLNSKIPVNTYIDGMAYSMAGVVAMVGKKRYIADYGTFMMHEADGNAANKILDLITNSLATVFASTMSWDMEKVKTMMAKETWMTAAECEAENMFVLVPTGKSKPITNNAKELYTFYNSIINEKPTPKQMLKVTNKLKLTAEASEDAILNAVETLVSDKETALAAITEKTTEIANLTAEKVALEAKLKTFEDGAAATEVANVELEIANAIKDNKITAESKQTWLDSKMPSAVLKNMFASMKANTGAVKIFNAAGVTDANGITAERKDWKYSDWERKDPKGLLELKNTNGEAFTALVKTI